jgi:hypothetical protein
LTDLVSQVERVLIVAIALSPVAPITTVAGAGEISSIDRIANEEKIERAA